MFGTAFFEKGSGLSVRWKILGPMALTAAALIGLSTYMTLNAFDVYIDREIRQRAQLIVEVVSHAVETIHHPAELEKFFTTLVVDSEIEMITIIDGEDGRVIASAQSHDGETADGVSHESVHQQIGDDIHAWLDEAGGDEEGTWPKVAEYEKEHWQFVDKFDHAHLHADQTGHNGFILVRLDANALYAEGWGLAWRLASWPMLVALLAILSMAYLAYEFIIKRLDFLGTILDAHRKGDDFNLAHNKDDEFGALASALVDMFRTTRESEARLANLARRDSLTGLANRTFFKDRLNHDLAVADRSGAVVGLMLLDLDNFKDVNDTLGHDVGDKLLQHTADILRACARKSDTIARLGGDEFAIILSQVDSPSSLTRLATRIIQALAQPKMIDSYEIHPGTSIGITIFPQDGRDPDVLLKNADLALYRAKAEGRGNFQIYRHELHLRAMERNAIERDLRQALIDDQFLLYYQPKIDLKTGAIIGAEALVRWNHPERGIIAPAMFVPVAESNGFIVELTRWVLGEACRQNRAWQDDGLPAFSVAVNVSAADLRRPDLTDRVASTLIRSGLSPRHLEIEVTESMVMGDVDFVTGTLRRLRSLGVTIAIDDFGTGYCSLSYLKRFPVNRLKIDQSFVHDMLSVRDGDAIPKVIIDLSRSLGVRVVAEGVETAQQLEALRKLGCDEAQGYYLGRPSPAAEFAEFVRHYRSPIAAVVASAGTDRDDHLSEAPDDSSAAPDNSSPAKGSA